MQLDQRQRLVLQFYREDHQAGRPLWGRFARRILLPYAVLAICFVSMAIAMGSFSPDVTIWFAVFVSGLLLGGLVRDFREFNFNVSHFWPVIEEITAWQRVDQLLDQPSTTT